MMVKVFAQRGEGVHRLLVRDDTGRHLGYGDVLSEEMVISPKVDPNIVWRALCAHVDWPSGAVHPEGGNESTS